MADNRDLQREYYDKVYKSNNLEEKTSTNIKSYFVDRFLDMAIRSEKQKILEIGCGSGTLTQHLLDRRLRVHAIDISSAAIECLRTRFVAHIDSGQLVAQCGDILDYLKGHTGFDLIIGSGIIHHIEKTRRADFFVKIYNALNDTGTFACAPEPNANGLYSYLWRLAGWIYRRCYNIDFNEEVEKGTFDMQSESLIRELKWAGFVSAEISPYQVLPHFSSKHISLIDRKLVEFFSGKWALYTIIKAAKSTPVTSPDVQP